MVEPSEFTPELRYSVSQAPWMWWSKARLLRGAAELIMCAQEAKIQSYVAAAKIAEEKAAIEGWAEIEADCPDFLTPMMLYAFAIENLLKGLIIAKDPSRISMTKLNPAITEHDLLKLADLAGMRIGDGMERVVLKILSEIGIWAGRYPTATRVNHQETVFPLGVPTNRAINWGTAHDSVREFFHRAEGKLREQNVPLEEVPERDVIYQLAEENSASSS